VFCVAVAAAFMRAFQVLKVVVIDLVDVLRKTPQERIQWGYIWRPRRPSDLSTSADPSPSHLCVRLIPNMVSEMRRRMRVSRVRKHLSEFSFPMT
jgi:hypothetical protein